MPQPKDFKFSSNIGTSSVFAIAPDTWLCSSENPTLLDKANDEVPGQTLYLADLSHAWTRIILSGEESSTLLMRGFPVDLSNAEFPEFRFAKSVIHGMPLLIHRLGKTSAKGSHDTGAIFDLYVQRSFAVSFWEWLVMHASSFSYKVV